MTPARILVVEDNPLNLKLVRDVLRVAGYDVLEARSGEEGLAVTAFAMTEDRERAAHAGFDGYLEKPISVRQLANQVAAFLARRST